MQALIDFDGWRKWKDFSNTSLNSPGGGVAGAYGSSYGQNRIEDRSGRGARATPTPSGRGDGGREGSENGKGSGSKGSLGRLLGKRKKAREIGPEFDEMKEERRRKKMEMMARLGGGTRPPGGGKKERVEAVEEEAEGSNHQFRRE